jgi:hypothetical protein
VPWFDLERPEVAALEMVAIEIDALANVEEFESQDKMRPERV